MIRRTVIAWVLVPSLLLNQSVTAVAYTHCAGLTGEHDHRPHFHVPFLSNIASHPNHCSWGRCPRAASVRSVDDRRSETPHLFAKPGEDHDSDAVYIDRIPLVAQKRGIGTAGEDEVRYEGVWDETCWEAAVRPPCFGERIRGNELPALLSVAIHVIQQRWQL